MIFQTPLDILAAAMRSGVQCSCCQHQGFKVAMERAIVSYSLQAATRHLISFNLFNCCLRVCIGLYAKDVFMCTG